MLRKSVFSVILLLCLAFTASAQKASKLLLQKNFKHQKYTNASLSPNNFFRLKKDDMGLTLKDEMIFQKSHASKSGTDHIKFTQTHNHIPVLGACYTLHVKNGIVKRSSGKYLPKIDIDTKPGISSEIALEVALNDMKSKQYGWEDHSLKDFPSLHEKPTPTLRIMDVAYPQSSEFYTLVYSVDIYSVRPLDKQRYLIDAKSGKVLKKLPLLMHQSVPAKGVCKYYGEQDIMVDSLGPNLYALHDDTRGGGITVRQGGQIFQHNDKYWDLTNEDQDEVAIDAHYTTAEFYDFMLEQFNWKGIDNADAPLNAVIHIGDVVNAYWNGASAAFADGDCNNGPLTTLEVVGHEFAHGFTQYTSELIYSGESGAINESLSDVFGKGLEYFVDPEGFNWFIGESFKLNDYSEPFRSMEYPNDFNDPAMYRGLFWNDNGGVHTNSSIGNLWFFNLVEGQTGTNEAGVDYDVVGIGMEKALQIVFETQVGYLYQASGYQDYYDYSVLAAEDIYGAGSQELASVKEAWKVVGLPVESGNGIDLAIGIKERFVNTCVQNDYAELTVLVSNVGSIDYAATDGAFIESDGDFGVDLDVDIPVGDTVEIVIPNGVFFDQSDFEYVSLALVYEDDSKQSNNSSYLFVENFFHEINDVELKFININGIECFNKTATFNAFINNVSCSPLPIGSTVLFEIKDLAGDIIHSELREMPEEIGPGDPFFFQGELDNDKTVVTEYMAEVSLAGDPNNENNFATFDLTPFITIDSEYYNPFNTNDVYPGRIEGFAFEVNEYQNENYLLTTGNSTGNFQNLCEDLEGSSELRPAVSMKFCLDLTGQNSYDLDFDLVQFRNENASTFTALAEYTSILNVYWENDEFADKYIYHNQPEGISEHHKIELPENFKGELTLDFMNYTGDRFGDVLNFDVMLIDNLELSTAPVAVNDTQEYKVNLYPNPTNGMLYLRHESEVKRISISNAQGNRLINQKADDQQTEIDLKDLPDGYYLVQVVFEDDSVINKSLVKMSK